MKRLVGALIVIALVVGLFGTTVFAQRQFLSMASGWVVGVYYPMAGAISRIVYKADLGIRLTVESSGASVANSKLIQGGDADFAILQNDIAYYAYTGSQLEAFEGNPVKNMRGVLSLYPEPIQVVARANAGIETISDLKGKRVAVGPLGSGTEANTRNILNAYGLSFDDLGRVERLGAAEASDYLKDGRIDAAFFTVGIGAAAIQNVAVVTPIKVIAIDDKIDWLRENYSFYSSTEVPVGSYKGLDESVPTVAVKAVVVAREELDDDIVYKVLKALFDDIDTLHSAHAAAKNVTLDSALDAMSVPLHAGAKRFYEEAGIL